MNIPKVLEANKFDGIRNITLIVMFSLRCIDFVFIERSWVINLFAIRGNYYILFGCHREP